MPIEKIIHQIWIQGKDQIPEKFLPNTEGIVKLHPNWKYILWCEIKIIRLLRQNKVWLDTYYKFNYLHQKIDYAKYVILYKFGGVYVDMDAVVLKSFDSLLDSCMKYDLIVSKINLNRFESMLYCQRPVCINNGIIMAQRSNSIIKKLVDSIDENPTSLNPIKFFSINHTTGPSMFTKIILDNMNDQTMILKPEYLEPQIFGMGDVTSNTYAIHQHEGSWLNKSFKKFGEFYIRNRIIVYILLVILVLIFMISFNYGCGG